MSKSNADITFKGQKLPIAGASVKEGAPAPKFKLTLTDFSDIENSAFAGKTLILSVVPSLDTPVCAIQTKRFNQEATALGDDVKILTVSMDLPFAQKRWCGAEGVENVQTASDFKYRSFGETYGTYIQTMGILARAIFIIDKSGTVRYVEYVNELSSEPNYEAALEAARAIAR